MPVTDKHESRQIKTLKTKKMRKTTITINDFYADLDSPVPELNLDDVAQSDDSVKPQDTLKSTLNCHTIPLCTTNSWEKNESGVRILFDLPGTGPEKYTASARQAQKNIWGSYIQYTSLPVCITYEPVRMYYIRACPYVLNTSLSVCITYELISM